MSHKYDIGDLMGLHNSYTNPSYKQKQADKVIRLFGEKTEFKQTCKVCETEFLEVARQKLGPKKKFCSRRCANSTGGKAKATKYHTDDVAGYVTVCWRHHEKKCVVCGEERVVAVHHLNEQHLDNRPENLVPLCPTHHQYMHSKHRKVIQHLIDAYVKSKWGIRITGLR